MGIFSRNFDKPGPGIPKDIPRKQGAARFFELLFRDFMDYVKLSLLFCLCVLPSAAAFCLGILGYIFPFFTGIDPQEIGGLNLFMLPLILSLPLAYPVGGALVACYFNITRLMRDDASYLWYDFKRKFKENHKQAALPGIFCTLFVYMQILLWFQIYFELVTETYTGGLMWIILAVFSLLLFGMITPYIFLHYSYIDLKSTQVLRNSLLMTFAYLPRSFMGALTGGIIWIAIALFLPNSLMALPMIPLILVALSMLLTLSWIWPKFEAYFKIEEALIERREKTEAL